MLWCVKRLFFPSVSQASGDWSGSGEGDGTPAVTAVKVGLPVPFKWTCMNTEVRHP